MGTRKCKKCGLVCDTRGITMHEKHCIGKRSKICPNCLKEFFPSSHYNKTRFCCISCGLSYGRRGKNNPNWKDEAYRTTCALYHDMKCIICGEENVVATHHYDGNKKNNHPTNLLPLCPTHHTYWHSKKLIELIREKVETYRELFFESYVSKHPEEYS